MITVSFERHDGAKLTFTEVDDEILQGVYAELLVKAKTIEYTDNNLGL